MLGAGLLSTLLGLRAQHVGSTNNGILPVRMVVATKLWGHFFSFLWDWVATGPTTQIIGPQQNQGVFYNADTLEMGFNADFFRDGVESMASDEITLKLISPLRPAVMKGGEDDPTYLVMPIRLAG